MWGGVGGGVKCYTGDDGFGVPGGIMGVMGIQGGAVDFMWGHQGSFGVLVSATSPRRQ